MRGGRGQRAHYNGSWIEWRDKKGKIRRDDGPAVISVHGDSDGSLYWYRDGFLHREGNKPAVIKGNGELQWWIRGVPLRRDHGDGIQKPIWVSSSGALRWVSQSTGIVIMRPTDH